MEPYMASNTGSFHWPDLRALWQRFSKETRLAFLSALLMGFVAHLYVFSNLLINHDGALSLLSENAHLTSGRWSLAFFSALSGIYELPVVLALLVVLALACTAALTVKLLGISSQPSILLTAGFLVTFPSICVIFPYLYTADAYLFALLLNALAVYLAKRWRWGWAPSILCIAVALGIYQSFVCYAVGLFLLDCILSLLDKEDIKRVSLRGLKYILTIAAGLVLYRVILAVLLQLAGTALSSYRGMDQAIQSGVLDYLRALPQAYLEFLRFFWQPSYLGRLLTLAQQCLLLLAIACGAYLLLARHLYKEPLRLALVLLGIALLPLALNLISIIIAGQTDVNLLMEFSFVLFYIFMVKVMELALGQLLKEGLPWRLPQKWGKRGALSWQAPMSAGLVVCLALIWNQFCLVNTGYLRVQLVYENSFALANRIVARVEGMEGFHRDIPVVLAGNPASTYGNRVAFPQLEEFPGMYTSLVNEYCGTHFIRAFIGMHKRCATPEQREEVMESGVLETMPIYPAQGSIQEYNGMILVKLSENWDLNAFEG